MLLDVRERRNVSNVLNVCNVCNVCNVSEIKPKSEYNIKLETDYIEKLKKVENIGLDLTTFEKRKINDGESLGTIFENGNKKKGQDPDGICIIIPKETICQIVLGSLATDNLFQYQYVNTETAEAMDDAHPGEYFFIESKGIKRSYKFIYSVKSCPSIYRYLMKYWI